MIVLDTHIWIYYVSGNENKLSDRQLLAIAENINKGLGVSIISCWEVIKKNTLGKLEVDKPIKEWIYNAIYFEGIILLDLDPDIILGSIELKDWENKDPMDQLIVATANCLGCELVTSDKKILNYNAVKTIF